MLTFNLKEVDFVGLVLFIENQQVVVKVEYEDKIGGILVMFYQLMQRYVLLVVVLLTGSAPCIFARRCGDN